MDQPHFLRGRRRDPVAGAGGHPGDWLPGPRDCGGSGSGRGGDLRIAPAAGSRSSSRPDLASTNGRRKTPRHSFDIAPRRPDARTHRDRAPGGRARAVVEGVAACWVTPARGEQSPVGGTHQRKARSWSLRAFSSFAIRLPYFFAPETQPSKESWVGPPGDGSRPIPTGSQA